MFTVANVTQMLGQRWGHRHSEPDTIPAVAVAVAILCILAAHPKAFTAFMITATHHSMRQGPKLRAAHFITLLPALVFLGDDAAQPPTAAAVSTLASLINTPRLCQPRKSDHCGRT